MKPISSPLSESDVRSLKAGDVVSLTGSLVTARDEAHIRALEYVHEGKDVPSCLFDSILFHCGPIMIKNDDQYSVVAAGPTTSARMNKLEPDFIRTFRIKAIIGKGGMSSETVNAMKEVGCVYLAAVGGAAVSLAESLSVQGVEWEDLGMAEAVWMLNASSLGPLVVAIDSQGNDLYADVRDNIKKSF